MSASPVWRPTILCALALVAAKPAPPEDEAQIWRTTVRHVIRDEDLSTDDLAFVAPSTFFPRRLTARIAATEPEPACGFAAGEWSEAVEALAGANRRGGSVVAALRDEPHVSFVAPPEEGDFIGLSRVLLLDSGQRALWSASISNIAGALMLHERTSNGWVFVAECAEWAVYGD